MGMNTKCSARVRVTTGDFFEANHRPLAKPIRGALLALTIAPALAACTGGPSGEGPTTLCREATLAEAIYYFGDESYIEDCLPTRGTTN